MGKPGGWDYAPHAAQRIVALEQEMSAKDAVIRDLMAEVDSWRESHASALALLAIAKDDARRFVMREMSAT